MTYVENKYANVLTSTKHVFLSELTFYSYQITFPRDFTYGQVAGRLSRACLILMSQDIAATYALTYQEGDLTAELLCHKPVTQDTIQKTMIAPLNVSMGPKETQLKFADSPKPLKTLLDLWLRQKMRQLKYTRDDFLYIFHKEKKFENNLHYTLRQGLRLQLELTTQGDVLLWVDIGHQIRFSLVAVLNQRLLNNGYDFSVEQIGALPNEEREKFENILLDLLEFVNGQYAKGRGTQCAVQNYSRQRNEFFRGRGTIIDAIGEWTDQHYLDMEEPRRKKTGPLTLDAFIEDKTKQTLHDYLSKRPGESPPIEYPTIRMKTQIGRQTKIRSYTPSDVFVQLREVELPSLEPIQLHSILKTQTEHLLTNLHFDFPFLSEPIALQRALPPRAEFKAIAAFKERIQIRDATGVFPLAVLKKASTPLAGQINLHLVVYLPQLNGNRNESKQLVDEILPQINQKLQEHNLGQIIAQDLNYYEWLIGNPARTRANLINALHSLREMKTEEGRIFPFVIGPNYDGAYFIEVKTSCSQMKYHSQILRWDTAQGFNEYIAVVLACDIYIESVLQENIDRLEELDGLVWILQYPADAIGGKKGGETVYIGFDHSWDAEGQVGAAFIMICDSWGRLISASKKTLTTDYIPEKIADSVFRTILRKAHAYAKKQDPPLHTPKRVVFFRHGVIRAGERRNLEQGFKQACNSLDIAEIKLDLVEVVERHSKRLLQVSSDRKTAQNPVLGTYLILPTTNPMHNSRGIVIASEPKKRPNGKSLGTLN